MRNQRLITLFVILFLSISNAQEQFESYKDIEKIPNGMNIIHDNARTQAIVGIHGFYPISVSYTHLTLPTSDLV